ncbi:hypothetical protein LAZ67_18000070, partial [Cordylochernes scorpioides]
MGPNPSSAFPERFLPGASSGSPEEPVRRGDLLEETPDHCQGSWSPPAHHVFQGDRLP